MSCFNQLIENGNLYLAQPPLFKITKNLGCTLVETFRSRYERNYKCNLLHIIAGIFKMNNLYSITPSFCELQRISCYHKLKRFYIIIKYTSSWANKYFHNVFN